MVFRDNGDGTVSDDSTGLMWEKKTDHPTGSADVHNVTYRYSWSAPQVTGTEPDGTAFTMFLRILNENQFAGHSDWRLPTRQELLSIVARDLEESAIGAMLKLAPDDPDRLLEEIAEQLLTQVSEREAELAGLLG